MSKYYQVDKERLRKNAREKYQSLSKEEKENSDNMVVKTIQKSIRRCKKAG